MIATKKSINTHNNKKIKKNTQELLTFFSVQHSMKPQGLSNKKETLLKDDEAERKNKIDVEITTMDIHLKNIVEFENHTRAKR